MTINNVMGHQMRRSLDRRDFAASIELQKGVDNKPRFDGVVVPDGDCWICKRYERHGTWIIASFDADDMEGWHLYRPLTEEPDLFLKFSKIWQDKNFPSAAQAFVSRFGLPRNTGRRKGSHQPTRLSLQEFFEESQRAWVALTLYESVLNKDGAAAEKLLAEYRDLDEAFDEYHKYMQQWTLPDTVALTPLQGALAASVSVVDDAVTRLCRQGKSVHFDRPDPDPSSAVKVTWSFDNLLGAMYLQMWWVVSSSGHLSRCEHCSRLISLTRPALGQESAGATTGFAMPLAARLITGARSGLKTTLTDRGLTVTWANVRKHQVTLDLKIGLN